jgi:predicted PurR-regulated permease PerM
MKDQKSNITVTVSNRTVLRIIALVLAAYLLFHFLSGVTHILTLISVAAFLAIALNPAVSWITRRLKSRSRVAATGLAYVTVLTIIIGFFSYIIPPLVQQTAEFISDVPRIISDFKTQDSAAARFVRNNNLDDQLDNISRDFSRRIAPQFKDEIFSTATRIGSTIISIIIVLVLTFMMLVEGPRWLQKYWAMHDPARRERHKNLAYQMYRVVTGYVNGQLIIAMIAGGFALVALFIASTVLNAPVNAVALAGIVTLTGLIPMIGNTLGAFIVVLASLLVSAPLAIVMAIFFLVYQQVENVTIQPHIQARQNNLTPLLVFIAALLGVGLGGLLGGLVAIPVAGCIKILLEDYSNHRKPSSKAKA